MGKILYLIVFGIAAVCETRGDCGWQSEEDMNVLGDIIQTHDGPLAECQQLCLTKPACKSLDFTVENGVETCQLNSVTKEEALSYVSSAGVTHYFCADRTYLTTDKPPDKDSGEMISVEEFWEWLRDDPVYFGLIGFGVAIVLLVLVIIIILCCYVGKVPKHTEMTDEVIGLAPIYEEAEEYDDDKPTSSTNHVTDNVGSTNRVSDSIGYVAAQPIQQPETEAYLEPQPEVNLQPQPEGYLEPQPETNRIENPIYGISEEKSIEANIPDVEPESHPQQNTTIILVSDPEMHPKELQKAVQSEPTTQTAVLDEPTEIFRQVQARPDSLSMDPPPSELSNTVAYQEPIPIPPPPPALPNNSWNPSTE